QSVQVSLDNPTKFSVPRPETAQINTVSDEITPFFDTEQQVLYFASNGHPSLGGLDVFRSTRGPLGDFQSPENLGAPVNSAADDYGLSLAAGTGRGYLTSNRTFSDEKLTTTETDIFALNFRVGRARLKAMVYDNTTGSELGGAEVILYQLGEGNQSTEIKRRQFPTGVYDFNLQPGQRYRVEISREGYQGTSYLVETSPAASSLYGQPVFLLRRSVPQQNEASTQVLGGGRKAGDPPPTAKPRGAIPTSSPPPAVSQPDPAPATSPTTTPPVAYRIQISAASSFDPNDGKFEAIRTVGNLQSEPIPGKKLFRITVGFFTTKAAAKEALNTVQRNGFPSAFAVRYDNGERHGLVRLR
ncbi:MAG: SPOR domain-containing protein, partial [Bacteroidota bacterium]